MATTSKSRSRVCATPQIFSRIAVAFNGLPEGEDALALGAALAEVGGAELMLVAVHPDLLVVLPSEMDSGSMRDAARVALWKARTRMAPRARTVVERDVSVPRALRRVIEHSHRDLLVLGSNRRAEPGRLRAGKRTRQLLRQFNCAVAIAPRGLHRAGRPTLTRIGVGYDFGPESQAALERAAALAAGAGGRLFVHRVLDDRPQRPELIQKELDCLGEGLDALATELSVPVETEVHCGRPADYLLELADEVDLLVIGSRRWGPVARVVLGGTGEALLHGAACPVVAVPRPAGERDPGLRAPEGRVLPDDRPTAGRLNERHDVLGSKQSRTQAGDRRRL
jgi:nucleotide-binding universal stress UspA family protein